MRHRTHLSPALGQFLLTTQNGPQTRKNTKNCFAGDRKYNKLAEFVLDPLGSVLLDLGAATAGKRSFGSAKFIKWQKNHSGLQG